MFNKVFQDLELCLELARLILPGLNIERIEFPERPKSLAAGIFMHSVRFDVYTRTDKGRNHRLRDANTVCGQPHETNKGISCYDYVQ